MALALTQKETEKAEAKDARRATVLADGAKSVVSSKGLGAEGDVRALNLNMDNLKLQLKAAEKAGDSGLVQSIGLFEERSRCTGGTQNPTERSDVC